jgi:hypothetical protein
MTGAPSPGDMQGRIHKEPSADCRERRVWVRLLGIRRTESTLANEELLGANYLPAREELGPSPDGSLPASDWIGAYSTGDTAGT